MGLRWRVGRKIGRTIYAQEGDSPSDGDALIGMMDSRSYAEKACLAFNTMQRIYEETRREMFEDPYEETRKEASEGRPAPVWTRRDQNKADAERLRQAQEARGRFREAKAKGGSFEGVEREN